VTDSLNWSVLRKATRPVASIALAILDFGETGRNAPPAFPIAALCGVRLRMGGSADPADLDQVRLTGPRPPCPAAQCRSGDDWGHFSEGAGGRPGPRRRSWM